MNENRSVEANDLGALTKQQQQKLDHFKVKTRVSNESYLRDHPEVDCLIQSFIREICTSRPDNVREFAAEFFTDPELPLKIRALAQQRQTDMKNVPKE